MYLSRMYIDRFGVLHEQDVSGISPGISVFLGRNEAGKSTCLHFLQAMLFGYRRGGRSLDPMPTRSSRVVSGGSLFLQTEKDGPLILTRRPGARGGELSLTRAEGGGGLSSPGGIHGANGGEVPGNAMQSGLVGAGAALDERDLQNLLTGLTADMFDSIFAFSLKQLMELSTLKGDSVRHALHGAAFGTGMQSPVQVLKILEDRMSALLKRDVASASAPVNNSLRELAAVRAELQARGPDLERYEQLHHKLEELEQGLGSLTEQRDSLTIALRKVERRLSVWQQWEEVRRLRAELESLGVDADSSFPADRFAPDALQRFESLLVQQEERLFALRGAEGQMARLERECEQLRLLPVLTGMYSSVQALREQKDQRRHEAQSLLALRGEVQRLQAEQSQALDALGQGWDIDAVLALDSSVASFDAVRTASEHLDQASRRCEQAGQNLLRCKEEQAESASLARNTEQALAALEAKYRNPEERNQGAVCNESGRYGGHADDNASFFPGRIQRLRHMERLVREHASLEAEQGELLERRGAPHLRSGLKQHTLWSGLAGKGLSVFLASTLVLVCGVGITGYSAYIRDPLLAMEGGVLSLLGLAVFSMTLRSAWLGVKEQNADLADFRSRLEGYARRKEAVEQAIRALLAAVHPWFSPSVAPGTAFSSGESSSVSADALNASAVAGEYRQTDAGSPYLPDGMAEGPARNFRPVPCPGVEAASAPAPYSSKTAGTGSIPGENGRLAGAGLEHSGEFTGKSAPDGNMPGLILPDAADIALALRAVEEDSRREQALRSQLAERLARARHTEQARAAADEAARVAEEELRHAKLRWQHWLEERSLRLTLSPQGAGEIMQYAREAAKRNSTLVQLYGQQAIMEKNLAAFIASVRAMVREAAEAGELPAEPGMPGEPGFREDTNLPRNLQDSLRLLDTLGDAVERASRDGALHMQKREQLEAGTLALGQRQEALELTRGHVAGLLASAGCADAESFRTAYARWSRIEAIRAEERNLLSGIRALAAEEGARMEDVLASLELTTLDRLEEERLALSSELAGLADNIRSLTEERGQLKERQSALATDGSGSLLRSREAALCEDLHRYSREWSVLALARQLLLDAKARYEKEGREGVLRFASEIFHTITDGEYSGIIASLEGENFLALHSSGEQRDPEKELSQGTREQLYLALRLAYVKNHARSAEALPVIMDETLVNFDPGRIRNTARVLAAFARENQILAFTCHSRLADILLEAGEQAAGPAPSSFSIAQGVISRQ